VHRSLQEFYRLLPIFRPRFGMENDLNKVTCSGYLGFENIGMYRISQLKAFLNGIIKYTVK